MAIDIYDYIASADPNGAVALIQKYGYTANAQTTSDVSTCLAQLIQAEGANAFQDMLELHPDKEVILEQYSGKTPPPAGTPGCPGCNGQPAINQYLANAGAPAAAANNAVAAATTNTSNFLQSQGNLFLIAGFILVAVALLKSNK